MVFGIEYSATDLTTAATTITASDKDPENKYCCQATGLSSNTLYYYRAYTLFNGVRSYGEVKTFTTKDFSVTVTTLDVTRILPFSATLNGLLQVESHENLSKSVWFLYSNTASTLEALRSGGIKASSTLESDGTFKVGLSGLSDNTRYYFVSVSKVLDKEFYGEVKTFITHTMFVPQAVDMGIVVNGKNIKWGSFNIGASSPEEYGLYYAWGETEPKSNYSWSTYKFGTGSSFSKYNTNSSYGAVDNKTVLDPEDDVAHVKLGGKWRMPTDGEWTALRTQCTWTWTTQNGVNGILVTASNGNSIFLPAAGYRRDADLYTTGSHGPYWSSSLNTGSPDYAWGVAFNSGNVYRDYGSGRYVGSSVRPVSE